MYDLVLYYYPTCPYCRKVTRFINKNDLNQIELTIMDKLRIIQTIEQTIYKSLKVSQKLNREPANWSNCDEIKILETIVLKIGDRNELPLQKSSKI